MEATVETRPRTISVEDAARELGIGRQLAYQLARSGELPGVLRLGRRYVVSRQVLEATLAEPDSERRSTLRVDSTPETQEPDSSPGPSSRDTTNDDREYQPPAAA